MGCGDDMIERNSVDAIARLRNVAELGSLGAAGSGFVRADLREADLSGLQLPFVSLAGARLDGANLRGSRLRHVDLTGASLAGADLTDASLELVHATTASFAGARLTGARIEHTALNGANFAEADLRRAMIRVSSLDGASFADADLTRAVLTDCVCAEASFRGALLDRTDTGGSSFPRADFTAARRFFLSREIVTEVIRRETGDDVVSARLLGAVQVLRWCYAESRQALVDFPGLMERALDILGRYPESGAMEALRDGWRRPGPGRTADHGHQVSGIAGSPWPAPSAERPNADRIESTTAAGSS
jgi:uncharacterized protein YjbI with pentapeptide repeats